MNETLSVFIKRLKINKQQEDVYIGNLHGQQEKHIFGGLLLSQALIAAQNTEADKILHSMHAYFLLPATANVPIKLKVNHLRDGLNFATKRIDIYQQDNMIFTLTASYQSPEMGFEHQLKMPDCPLPDSLQPVTENPLSRGEMPISLLQNGAFEFREVDPYDAFADKLTKRDPHRKVWVKIRGTLPKQQDIHQAILAYISDMGLLTTSMFPHQVNYLMPNMQVASLDHSIWFHHPCKVDDWLLYVIDSDCAAGGRGSSRGQFFDLSGKLIATTAQEGLIRNIKKYRQTVNQNSKHL